MISCLTVKILKISSKIKTGVLFVEMSFSFIANLMSIKYRTPVCSLKLEHAK